MSRVVVARACPVWVEARQNNDFAVVPAARCSANLELRQPLHRLLRRRLRRAVRRAARRLRARHEDRGGAAALRVPEGAPGAARQGRRRRGPESRRAVGATFPLDRQKQFELEVVARFGFDDRRRGGSTRPCTRSRPAAGTQDIRLTTRYFDDNLDGLFATMHEFGHGLYEHQIDRSLERTPLARGTSLGLHESQSRMWENLVGRSLPFWRHFFPRLQERSPTRSPATTPSAGTARSTRVEPVADPGRGRRGDLQPAHHPPLRAGAGAARRDVPARGPAGGVEPRACGTTSAIEVPDDTHGVLQDMHWAGGSHRLLPDLRARQPDLGAALGARPRRPARPRRAVRAGRVRRAARLAARATCTATAASSRRPRRSSASSARRDRPRAVRALPAREARRHLRPRRRPPPS